MLPRIRFLSVARVPGLMPILLFCLGSGCARQPIPEAYDNQVFYEKDAQGAGDLAEILEKPFDALDDPEGTKRPYLGVEVLRGVARYSRPSDWVIRRGSLRPSEKFIEYVSPRQVVVSVYERIESPEETWAFVLKRYEQETEAQGGQIIGKAVPLATYDSQARAYEIRRGVPSGSEPFVTYCREYLVRSNHRILLVQVVRPREDFGEAEDEVVRFVQSLRVL